MRSIQIYLFFSICLLAASCNNKKGPDVSEIDLHIIIDRFDQKLHAISGGGTEVGGRRSEVGSRKFEGSDLVQKADQLRKKYTWFYDDTWSRC